MGIFVMLAQTMVTPLTYQLLHWGELQNSLLFCGASLQVGECV